MNQKFGAFEDTFEQGVQTVTQGVKKQTSDFAKATTSQVSTKSTMGDQGTNEQANSTQQMSDDKAQQFLSELYGKNKKTDSNASPNPFNQPKQNPIQQALGIAPKNPNEGKTPEELKEMATLRNELHKEEYYQKLVNSPKLQEERPAEKVEREEEEEKIKLIEEEKEKPSVLPQSVKQGTGERMPGAG